ncbi:MAG: CsiV family protein [Parahaliea sp.]
MMPRRLLISITLLGCLLSTQVLAEKGQWYRVELMIFTQGGSTALNQESWELAPQLNYPERYRFLIDPGQIRQRRNQYPDSLSKIDSMGRQIIEAPTQHLPARTDPNIPVSTSPPEETKPLRQPSAFVLRPHSERSFPGSYMQRQGGYQILFHESWLQTLSHLSASRSIVIDNSGNDQRYPQLQGSVHLYNNRFVQLKTNIWLNTQGRYLPESWQMPAPPLAPASLIDQTATDPAAATEDAPQTAPPYPFGHAIALKENQRIRTGEVHYIDHPVLGVAIKLTALTAQDLDSLASATEAELAELGL